MIKLAAQRYINNFRGFRREVWILAIITFINRAGTMVIPFLSKYLKEDLGFSYGQVGWVMVCFGSGSMLGSWLGGKLSDKIGFYKIMVFSLFSTGILFFSVQFVTSFYGLCAAFFGIMVVADMFRPAMFVSLSVYAKPENRTRALSLVRLAVNLGFAAGPALGGLIIMNIGYSGLFWADAASCILSIGIFALLVKEKKKTPEEHLELADEPKKSVMKDHIFWLFLFVSFGTAMTFFQLFSTLPLYHHEKYGLTELQTGLLMTLNGFLVFLLEMPIVGFFERIHFPKLRIVLFGAICMSLGFFVLLPEFSSNLLVLNILFLTFGEIFAFPFSNAFVLSRAPKSQVGNYMGLYTMSFSLAHILSAKTGLAIVSVKSLGYFWNWVFMGTFGLVIAGLTVYIMILYKREQLS
ncbi:MDR family MFS transporter [Flavobacterium silvaticum]|uniref:MFS transporter n=1 Tax=Flavobacterium silvaticum TaxID=1852020 RepID=A0A972JGC4_9FLAO|nr:MFS transporter [Flavobacterium silvaticum]NMH28904.1 MFS transporter [Flavobacterium silvaticum]